MSNYKMLSEKTYLQMLKEKIATELSSAVIPGIENPDSISNKPQGEEVLIKEVPPDADAEKKAKEDEETVDEGKCCEESVEAIDEDSTMAPRGSSLDKMDARSGLKSQQPNIAQRKSDFDNWRKSSASQTGARPIGPSIFK